jgi:hypothetical protein
MLVKIRKDCDLQSDKNIKDYQLIEYVNDAIRNAESLIMNEFAGHYETHHDYNVTEGDTYLTVPSDLFQTRIKLIQFDSSYQVKKIPLERLSEVETEDNYRYRLINDRTNGLRINIYPPIRDTQLSAFRVYYIRQVKQLEEMTDICDIPNVSYILSHVKARLMSREGHPMLESEIASLNVEKENLVKTMTYQTDDGEDTLLGPNKDSMADWDEYQIG